MSDQRITAEELNRELSRSPDYFARKRANQVSQEQNEQEFETASRPVIDDLAAAGLDVDTIAELRGKTLRKAVPVLVEWLGRTGNYYVEQELVRTLADKAAKPQAGPALVEYFERLDADDPLKHAVGNSIAVVAGDDLEEPVIRLASDPRHGRAREMLVVALGGIGTEPAVRAARDLLDDPEVAGHAVIALGEARAEAARDDVERFSRHDKAWVREEARRALRKIEGGRQS